MQGGGDGCGVYSGHHVCYVTTEDKINRLMWTLIKMSVGKLRQQRKREHLTPYSYDFGNMFAEGSLYKPNTKINASDSIYYSSKIWGTIQVCKDCIVQ